MKKLIWIFAICTTTFFACQKDAPELPDLNLGTTNVQSQSAQNALRVMSSIQELDRLGFGTPTFLRSGIGMELSGSAENGRTLSTARTTSDSTTVGDDPDDDDWDEEDEDDHECGWTTCATEEFIENADGSFTWILDYGEEGCEENGYFMKGKIVETFREDGNTFESTTEYFNFGDDEYSTNGTSTYSGTFTEPADSLETLIAEYSSTYSFTENLTIAYEDETFSVESEGTETENQFGSSQDSGFTKCTSSNGDFFHSEIIEPLYYSYACEYGEIEGGENNADSLATEEIYEPGEMDFVFVYVSGIENIMYQEMSDIGETISGDFTIDYGNGECDNIVIITENGVSETVDLGQEWEEEWEEEDADTVAEGAAG